MTSNDDTETTEPGVLYVPPILRGCEYVGNQQSRLGTQMVFSTPEADNATGFVRVQVDVDDPVYHYSVFDMHSHTLVHYRGRFGDRSKDEIIQMGGTGHL